MMHGILFRMNIYMVACILTKHKAFIIKMNMHMFLYGRCIFYEYIYMHTGSYKCVYLSDFIEIQSNDLWTCLNNGTCPMTVRKSHSNSCLCTSDLCATTECYVTDKESTFAIQCKIETESKYSEVCKTYPMIEKFTGKRIET